MIVAPINHISVDERGVAYVSGTTLKVAEIVIDTYSWNLTPAQILENYPQLTLAEIYAALAYYHDHRAELDLQLVDSDHEHKQLRERNPNRLSRKDFERRIDQTESTN